MKNPENPEAPDFITYLGKSAFTMERSEVGERIGEARSALELFNLLAEADDNTNEELQIVANPNVTADVLWAIATKEICSTSTRREILCHANADEGVLLAVLEKEPSIWRDLLIAPAATPAVMQIACEYLTEKKSRMKDGRPQIEALIAHPQTPESGVRLFLGEEVPERLQNAAKTRLGA